MMLDQEYPGHTQVQNVRQIIQGERVKSWVTSTLLAISVVINVWCGYTIRDVGTAKWLHDWDLNQFQNGPYVETKIKVGELEARVRALETSQACRR